MIVWKGDVRREKDPDIPHLGRRSWRWVIDVTWRCIELRQEVRFDDLPNPAWSCAGMYYSLGFTKSAAWGRQHVYYDGPHDSFSIGYLHACWSGDWCQKCYDGR